MSVPTRSISVVEGLVRTARPKQWVKNLLVLAAPTAAGVLQEGSVLLDAVLAVVAFALASSGTYFLNDAFDAEADRHHPTKRERPVAAGVVPVQLAQGCGVGCIVAALLMAAVIGQWEFVVVVAVYLTLSSLYSWRLKEAPVIELIIVASGFVLRAIGGAVATDVETTEWFLLTVSFGSLFVVTGKRFAEVQELDHAASTHRAVLGEYTVPFLRGVILVSLTATLLAYCLWALQPLDPSAEAAVDDNASIVFQLSIVPVVTALLRYLHLLETGHGGAPEDVITGDRLLVALIVVWAGLFTLGVYGF